MLRLDEKTVLVMGAGQTPGATMGNGRAAAILYARQGARVAAVDRNLDSAQETVDLIRAEGGEALALRADVTDEEAVSTVVSDTVERWGRIDVLHNNVGVSHRAGDSSVLDISADTFMNITSINLLGMVLACKHVIPVIRAAGGGSIINISSIAALVDHPTVGYKTSKTAVVALTKHLASQFAADGIRANAVLAGLMDTPMAVEHQIGKSPADRDEIVAARMKKNPLGAHGTAWDVAKAALFLVSDEAAFITGTSLAVDGGQSLGSL